MLHTRIDLSVFANLEFEVQSETSPYGHISYQRYIFPRSMKSIHMFFELTPPIRRTPWIQTTDYKSQP